MSPRRARAAVAAWTAPTGDPDAPTVQTVSPQDFHNGIFGVWPTFAPSSLPVLVPGVPVSNAVGYCQGILFWKANQPCRPSTNPSAYGYGPTTQSCVRAFNQFFGVSNSTTCSLGTWNAIQWCALNLPNRGL